MKTKPFDLKECIGKRGGKAIYSYPGGSYFVSILTEDTRVYSEYPILMISEDKRTIFYVGLNGEIHSRKGVIVLPVKTKTLYWNVYRARNELFRLHPEVGFDSEEQAKKKIVWPDLYVKTIPVEIEE